MTTPNPTLGQALSTMIREQRLSYATVARPGRLSRNTVRLIALGMTENPDVSTLAKIGLGLSVDPYTGEIDKEVLTMSLARLGRASGHQDLGEQWAHDAIPVLLATVIGSVERAAAWVDLITRYPELDVELVREAVERLARQKPPP
jgi:hypothetical protein